jgi:hypothetical protein
MAPTALPTSTAVGAALGLGDLVSLAEAQRRVDFPISTPTALGRPDELYVASPPAGGEVALVYHPRPGLPPSTDTGVGLLLTEFRASIAADFFGKGLGPGTRLEEVTIGGERGYWIEGQPHLFFYFDASGSIHDEPLRLAGNTLLWERNGITLRLEAALAKDEALRIAGTMN